MNIESDWQPFIEFLQVLNPQYFDFLGCSLASDIQWQQVFGWIQSQTGVTIRASLDATGNLAQGGNWILEDGAVDAKALYFTDLENFEGLLMTYTTIPITISAAGTHNWTCPAGVTYVQVECWGGGGAGGSSKRTGTGGTAFAGGGGGGAYASSTFSVTPGNNYTVNVGTGGVPTPIADSFANGSTGTSGSSSTFSYGATIYVSAANGSNATNVLITGSGSIAGTGGSGGSSGTGTIYNGGNGGTAITSLTCTGSGGSSGGTTGSTNL